jgi:hypothetical protein
MHIQRAIAATTELTDRKTLDPISYRLELQVQLVPRWKLLPAVVTWRLVLAHVPPFHISCVCAYLNPCWRLFSSLFPFLSFLCSSPGLSLFAFLVSFSLSSSSLSPFRLQHAPLLPSRGLYDHQALTIQPYDLRLSSISTISDSINLHHLIIHLSRHTTTSLGASIPRI